MKTKPTQHSVKELREIGIQPDILLCRTDRFLPEELRAKISLFCNVAKRAVITAKDVDSIYEVPLVYHQQKIDSIIIELLHLSPPHEFDLSDWEAIIQCIRNPKQRVDVGIVGKYIDLQDSYKSLSEALVHGGIKNQAAINLKWVDTELIEKNGPKEYLSDLDAILVPGGFGDRGINGKIEAVAYARKQSIPFLGICLGMQCAVIEFARDVLFMEGAHSSEFDANTPFPVIGLLEEQQNIKNFGGTMRLGEYPCKLKPGTKVYQAYTQNEVYERHRHRFEFNIAYRQAFENKGMVISGISPDEKLVEVIELENHPWFMACQFHPEFKSNPRNPHPIFVSFIRAACNLKKSDQG